MPRSRRVELVPLYVLHHRPWRDTSRMLEVFTRDYGRLTLFARGVRGPRSRSASLLQPFRLLLASWSGSGDTGQLTQAEAATPFLELPAAAMLPAWYLNELLLKLTVRTDPQPQVFDLYHDTLQVLAAPGGSERALRSFERRLLELLGYGIELAHDARSGSALRGEAYYHFHPGLGFVEVSGEPTAASFSGQMLHALREQTLEDAHLEAAKRLMRLALEEALEGRELRSRAVARAVRRSSAPRQTTDATTHSDGSSPE